MVCLIDVCKTHPIGKINWHFVIAASAPCNESYKEYSNLGCKLRYLPIWSLNELLYLKKSFGLTDAQVEELYLRVGGVPRAFALSSKAAYLTNFNAAINELPIDLETAVGNQIYKSDFSHYVLHDVVSCDVLGVYDFTKYSKDFASQYVLDEYLKKKSLEFQNFGLSFIENTVGTVHEAARYRVHEILSQMLLQGEPTFRMKCVSHNIISGKGKKEKLTLTSLFMTFILCC